MIRFRDQQCQFDKRAARFASSRATTWESVTSSVRAMINWTVRQSVLPSARTAATFGNRVSNASAWETTKLAAIGDRFMAAATSAVVRWKPVMIM
jgi:hypothetical protein